MTDAMSVPTEISVAQLVQAAGLAAGVARVDDSAKIPDQIEVMIATANRQLELVTGQLEHMAEIRRRITIAEDLKSDEKDQLHRKLIALHDARAAMAKP